MQTPAPPTTERARLIMQTLLQMEKQFGKGSVLQLGSRSVQQVSVIPTGSISLDAALGVGGFPRGRVMEVFGPESSGKTTLALQVIAQAQAAGGTAAFIDAEHALDPTYARALGVDVDNLLGFAARLRRASAGDHQFADLVECHRCSGGGLGGGLGSQGGARK